MIALTVLIIDSSRIADRDRLAASLSSSCQARLERIIAPERRRQFILGRRLMAQAAGCRQDQIIEARDYPVYADEPDWHASISHSGPYVAVVFSQGARVGLDIEFPARQRDWSALAERAFTKDEAAWIAAAISPEQQRERFQRIWTLREAAFKAGLRELATGEPAAFDPASEQAIGELHWRNLRHGSCHLSLACRQPFSATIIEIPGPANKS